jgi:hypothetical protein
VAVDKPGIKIGTIRDAPSDRILTTEIKSAEIVRIPLSPHIAADAAEMLRTGIADVFGADSGYPAAQALAGAKIVPGVFATVRVAAALPKGRSSEARAKLEDLIAEAKRTGGDRWQRAHRHPTGVDGSLPQIASVPVGYRLWEEWTMNWRLVSRGRLQRCRPRQREARALGALRVRVPPGPFRPGAGGGAVGARGARRHFEPRFRHQSVWIN